MTPLLPPLGLGVGWRPELALWIDRHPDLTFVEIIAENFTPRAVAQGPLRRLRERGVTVIPHGVSLSPGGADPVEPARIRHLADLARELEAPFVSEHIAFVRAGGLEAGHLLPIPRTRVSLDALCDNVRRTQDGLPVPLVLENVAALFEWPDAELDEAEFVGEVIRRTGAGLLLDLANVHANARNLGSDARKILPGMPLDRLAYVHVAGGVEEAGVYQDSHGHTVGPEVLELLETLAARCEIPGVLLERDEHFPTDDGLQTELDHISAALENGARRRAG